MTRTCTHAIRMAAAVTLVAAAAGASPARATRPGDERRWSLDFRARLEQPSARSVEVHLTGEWVEALSAVRHDGYDARLQIADVHVGGEAVQRVSEDALADLRRRLERPFWATYRSDGAIVAVHFFKDMGPADRNLLQMIATAAQLVVPPTGQPAWMVTERDAAGAYVAAYNRAGPDAIAKHKVKYMVIDGAAGTAADNIRMAIERSEARFSLDVQGGIASLDGVERVRIGGSAGDFVQATATTEIHLARLRRRSAPDAAGSLAAVRPTVTSSPIITQNPDPLEVQAQNDERLLEGSTTESLMAVAMSPEGDNLETQDRLTALFRRRPSAAADAIARLRKTGPRKRVTNALGASGSSEAVAALATLARDRTLESRLRVDALVAFVQMAHPSVAAMAVPPSLLNDGDVNVAVAAELTSGAVARAGRDDHPAEAQRIDVALIASYRKAGDDVKKICDALAGLGNSVGPSTVPVIEEALRDSRAPVRAAAVRALRLAPGVAVDTRLALAIQSDPDASVRVDALFASGFRRFASDVLSDAIIGSAKTDPIDYVRSDAISWLAHRADRLPRALETLAWVAEHDDRSGNRRLAREAVTAIARAGR